MLLGLFRLSALGMIYHTQGLAILHNGKKVYFGCVFHKNSILVARIVSPVTDVLIGVCYLGPYTNFKTWSGNIRFG